MTFSITCKNAECPFLDKKKKRCNNEKYSMYYGTRECPYIAAAENRKLSGL